MSCEVGDARGIDRALAAVVAAQRAVLTAEFGWTQLELEANVQPGLLRLRGCVALPRMTAGVSRAMAPRLPRGWRIDTSQVQVRAAIGWRAPGPGVTRLWRTATLALGTCPEGQAVSGLSTELLPGDGPVALLAELPGCALVRASDGTVGWVRGALAPAGPTRRRPPQPVPAEMALARLGARLRSYLGVRYRLGGATRRHIDCSGLVQRGVREALGLVLPRHSSDQLGLGLGAPARALGEPGDLLFMGGTEGAAWHVGVVLRGSRPGSRTLLHASARRGVVVEEPLERGLTRTNGRVQHIELAQLLERMSG